MYTLKTLSVMAIAATAVLAAPTPVEGALEARQWRGGNRFWTRPSPGAEVTTWGYGGDSAPEETSTPAPSSTPAPQVAAANNYGPQTWGAGSPAPAAAPAAAPVAAPAAPAAAPAAPVSSPDSSSSPPVSTGGGGDWFSIANKWRVAIGKPAFSESSKLVANAQDTADNSVGGLVHKLNPGSMGQVLGPGDASNFESVFLGGWLCELPNLPGLNGICATASGGWNHQGQTGHAEIIDGSYTSIGCAFGSGTGVWSCDFA